MESDLLRRIEMRLQFVADKLSSYTVDANGCWNYQGQTSTSGYGMFTIFVRELREKKRKFMAHRVAYAFHHGIDPKEKFVCHACDNPKCINPDHLWLGEAKDNTRDMWAKGRAAPQDGENNGAAKLKPEGVKSIAAMIDGGMNNKQIAEVVGVHHATVSLIRRRQAWRGVLADWEPKPVFSRKKAA